MNLKKPTSGLTQKEFNLKRAESSGRTPSLFREIEFTAASQIYESFMGRGSILLESVKGPFKIARYSFICFAPFAEYRIKDGTESVKSLCESFSPPAAKGKPLSTLRAMIHQYTQEPTEGLPPFQGGAAGLFCYGFAKYLERVPSTTTDDLNIPDAHIYFYDRLIAIDNKNSKAWAIVAPGAREDKFDTDKAYNDALRTLDDIEQQASSKHSPPSPILPEGPLTIDHDTSQADYMSMVERAKEYIAAGDIFQANLSLRVSAHIRGTSAWTLYKTLKDINPSPFAGFLDFGDYCLASSSPERLVKVSGNTIETRPIAGTRPRGQSSEGDEKMRKELLLNEKERAEHIMLIDLERNDMGRVCDYGSVHVDELMITEDYSHVIHIVSNVTGKLAKDKDMFDALGATFPGGTITGVPKVRCMEIIDELESLNRGPYTGAFGYMGYAGEMDLNIIIRTFTVKDDHAYVQAGAGVVADSAPEREYKESLKKAEALIRTLEKCGGSQGTG